MTALKHVFSCETLRGCGSINNAFTEAVHFWEARAKCYWPPIISTGMLCIYITLNIYICSDTQARDQGYNHNGSCYVFRREALTSTVELRCGLHYCAEDQSSPLGVLDVQSWLEECRYIVQRQQITRRRTCRGWTVRGINGFLIGYTVPEVRTHVVDMYTNYLCG